MFPGTVRLTGEVFFQYFAGLVRMDRAPGRIGFMDVQRREDRSTPATKTSRRGPRCRWRHASCAIYAGLLGAFSHGSVAQQLCSIARGGTAPPEYSAWLATKSLQSDCRIVQLVWLVRLFRLVSLGRQDLYRGSPPFGADAARKPEHLQRTRHPYRSSPFLSVQLGSHPTAPQFPAGKGRRAERYDGKRDMHLQHTA